MVANYAIKCPECGNGDDISLDDLGSAFCMECEHEWSTVTLGQRFFEAVRDAAGIPAGHGSVTAVARHLDIHRATVDRWHNGQQDPSSAHMVLAEARLDLSFFIFLEHGQFRAWFEKMPEE